jgi:signal transduction histidine kinase
MKSLKILIVEDVDTDEELICYELKKAGKNIVSERTETEDCFRNKIISFQPDIIISDYSLPSFNAVDALAIRNELAPHIPFILVTGATSEEVAVECVKKGADDYILKSSLTRLPSAIDQAIHLKKIEKSNLEALERLKDNEEKYRNLFNNSLIGMFRAEMSSTRIIEINEVGRNILGLEGDDYTLNCFLPDGTKEEFVREIFQNRVIGNFEVQVQRADMTFTWVSIDARLYFDDGVIEGTIKDISERKINLLQLQKVNKELESFAYHASHDLRSPLKSLMGLIDAIREENTQEELLPLFSMMSDSITRMDNLIHDLLELARMNQQKTKKELISIEDEIKDILHSLSYLKRFPAGTFSLNVKVDSKFYTDRIRLKTILNNVISNAIKYHPAGRALKLKINARVTAQMAEISIQDNGRGISPENQKKIFNMFYRIQTECEGSGLGLYIVKNNLEKIGGKVQVNSILDKGTTFYFEIPNGMIRQTGEKYQNQLKKVGIS